MEREDLHEELIELGTASVETQGDVDVGIEEGGRFLPTGILAD